MRPGKALYGSPWPNQESSENFVVVWENGQGNIPSAKAALDALEEAWTALVDQQDWEPPEASEDYLIWVILSRELSGTGVTTLYTDGNFPQGYPVIYMNPDWSHLTEFWASLSAHEFAHALQYSYRTWSTSAEEPWYWEASAEWQAELALPEVNAYAIQAQYYSEQSHLRFSSMENSHQYGMFLLNAFIEEHLTGNGGLRSIWTLAASRKNARWDSIIAEDLQLDFEYVIGGMSQQLCSMDFNDAQHYTHPAQAGALEKGSSGEVFYLGSQYWLAKEDALVTASGDVLLASPEGIGEEITVEAGQVLSVTGLAESSATYSLQLSQIPEDTGETGAQNPKDDDTGTASETPAGACACTSGPSQRGPFWIVAALCLPFFRRQRTSIHS